MTKLTTHQQNKYRGQVMLLSVIMLGGILVSATAIAGILMLYQIRQANDAVQSTRAFFAADAALEWQTYDYVCALPGTICTAPLPLVFTTPGLSASATTTVISSTSTAITSQGFSGRAVRALESVF
ncbi:hypothetical protein HY967_00820 [Candidatus Jorgensenbacteria bacterium]|nr:hypothetical protein [Candidatus Jorgensenbacteria bacterium]